MAVDLIRYYPPGTAKVSRPAEERSIIEYMILWGILASLAGTECLEEGAVYEFVHNGVLRIATFIRGRAILGDPNAASEVTLISENGITDPSELA
jgi:hypothetical protein